METDERGFVKVDAHLRTTAEGVYALGDVNGGPQQTYISLDDYRIVADDLHGDGTRTNDRAFFPTTIFTTPPLSRVGVSVAEAREQGLNALVASKKVADVAAMPRPKIEADPRGLITFVVDADTDLVLGATLLHVGSDEVINLVAMAMKHGITASALRDAIYIHPSATEALNEVLGELTPLDAGR